jgi:hypothetical protein
MNWEKETREMSRFNFETKGKKISRRRTQKDADKNCGAFLRSKAWKLAVPIMSGLD